MAQVKLPNGTLGLIVSSTNEAQQEDLFFPCDPRLFAVNVAGDPECGSLVFDLNKANEPDSARGAYLQSAFRVVKLPLGQPNAIAFQLDLTGKKDTQGGFFCEIMQAPVAAQGAGDTKSGPGTTVVQGAQPPPPDNGGFGFGEGSHNFGGPLHVGVADDKHRHGEDADGNPINALHIWTEGNFFKNRISDGPIRFELEYKEGKEKSHIVPAHLAWTGADWAIWTSTDFYSPEPNPVDPRRPRDPIGPVPSVAGVLPLADLLPGPVGVGQGGGASPLGPVESVAGVLPLDELLPPIDGRVPGSGVTMNLVATLSALMAPAMVFRPENYNTAVQSTGLYDIKDGDAGANQQNASKNASKADSSSPITAMASSFGAQGGFVDAGGSGSGTTHGGEGDPWIYTETPRGNITSGKKMSRFPGGTASGGIIYHPPETDLRDIDAGMVPDNVTLSETRIMCAPGASFGVGIPDLATGSIKTGANWAYDSSTGDLVWHTYSFTTESEAIRLTNPAQLIRWMSGQSFYGEFSHTNTANQTWTFPDVTATIGAMIFTVAAPSSTAPEGTFGWDVAANNLYVNNDGATSWSFIGGASSVTGSGANTRVAFWTGSTTLSSDAGLTYAESTDILSVTNSSANTNPQLILTQSSTGDSATRWAIGSTASFIAGIDNSDSDSWKLSYAASGTAVLGTGDYLTVATTGATTIAQWLNVGTATDATAQGDFAAGLTGAARVFYDQSVPAFYLYNSSGTIVNQISGVAGTATVWNEQGADIDFRVEGDTATQLFVCDAGTDRVKIGTGTAGAIAEFTAAGITFNDLAADLDFLVKGDVSTVLFKTDAGLDAVQIGNAVAGDLADFRSTVSVFNEGGADKDFRVESDDESYCLMVEGTLNNIVMCANAEPGFNSMDGGVFLNEANVVPTGNPTAGIYIYVELGAGKARGTSGTITTWAPAEPHCEVCGTDFGHEWENTRWGRLQFCVNCLADDIAQRNGGTLPKWIKREAV